MNAFPYVESYERPRDPRGRFKSSRPRWLRYIDSKPRTGWYLTTILALGFVQHLIGLL